jgi:hypothetical protein
MIDMATERVVTLAEASRRLPLRRGAKKAHLSTLVRWTRNGVRADDGTTAYLETIRVGRTLCTSLEAIQRFCERLSAKPISAPGPRSVSDKKPTDDQASAACERIGL